MSLTVEQEAEIATKLSVDLTTVADKRLIELCLLYRSAPEALPTFPTLLEAEITRRFTAAEIAVNDVMFSVIQNFSNQFNPELQYKEKMYEFVNALDRDLWLTQNITFFEQLIEIPERMAWVANNGDIMSVLSTKGVAMTRIAASSVAMTAVAASSLAMTAVAASSLALSAIVKSTSARNALMSSNEILQGSRVAIYNTVKTSWTKQAGISEPKISNADMSNINAAVASPAGFVFASLGWYNNTSTGISSITHPNSILAAAKGTSYRPTTLDNLDAISFNGATFKGINSDAQVYAELWIPPA